MLRIDIYPVMDGLEMWVAGRCSSGAPGHEDHRGENASTYIDRQRLDQRGLEPVVGFEVGAILAEFPGLAARASC